MKPAQVVRTLLQWDLVHTVQCQQHPAGLQPPQQLLATQATLVSIVFHAITQQQLPRPLFL